MMEKRIIHSTSLFEVDDGFQDDRFMKVRVTAMHSGINRNNSKFDIEVIKEAKDSFANIPILAEVKEFVDENGETYLDYTTHAMHIEDDKFNEGESRVIYDEAVVGIVPETNNFEIVHDDETGNDYVLVDALIFREYGNYACDVLDKRGGKTDVSAEIACEDIAFSAKDKCINVGKMRMCAITLLGEDVKPGMAKAHAEVFSSNEDDRNSQLIKIMQELKESLDNYTGCIAQKSKEGGNQMFESLLEKYGKTAEEITFNIEGLSDEELEVAFAEAFAEDEGDAEEPEAPASEESEANPEAPENEEDVAEDAFEDETDLKDVEEDKFSLKYSVTSNDNVREFSISLSEKLYAMHSLINETYGELDNEYYDINVFEEDAIVEMYGWFNGRSYRQSFKSENEAYQLIGDRVEIYSRYLTEDEINALET